jgi:hypothetical protein
MLKGKEGCIEVQTKLYGMDLKNLLRNENSDSEKKNIIENNKTE